MNNLYISQIIKKERKAHRMSQEKLSMYSDVSLATIRAIEQGTSCPNLNTLNKILALFNLELQIKKVGE